MRCATIVGQVRRPGHYRYRNGMTLIDGAALAGGYSRGARAAAVTIGRAAWTTRTADTPVLPADVISLPERFF